MATFTDIRDLTDAIAQICTYSVKDDKHVFPHIESLDTAMLGKED